MALKELKEQYGDLMIKLEILQGQINRVKQQIVNEMQEEQRVKEPEVVKE